MTFTCHPVAVVTPATVFAQRVGIAIAAYNEAPHLAELVRRCVATGPARIVIVDDCSTDDTATVLAGLARAAGGLLVVLRNPRNLGKQGSVRRALRHLRAERDLDAVALIDGDLQHEPTELPALAGLLASADLVIGARRTTEMPIQRRLSNWLVNGTFRWLAGVDFGDVQSGLRLFRKPLADALGDRLPERGGFGVEHESLSILAELSRQKPGGLRAVAAPITCRYADEVSHIGVLDLGRLAVATVRQSMRLRQALRARRALSTTRPALAP